MLFTEQGLPADGRIRFTRNRIAQRNARRPTCIHFECAVDLRHLFTVQVHAGQPRHAGEQIGHADLRRGIREVVLRARRAARDGALVRYLGQSVMHSPDRDALHADRGGQMNHRLRPKKPQAFRTDA